MSIYKQIKDFIQKNNVDSTDQILIQEAGGTTKKTTQAEILKTSGDVVVYRGTNKEFELGDEVFESASTGLYSFGGLSTNADPTLFDCGIVDGHIVDFNASTYDKVTYAGGTGLSPATANGVTYVLFNKLGNLVTQTSQPTDEERRDFIYVGRVVTIAGNVVQTQDEPVIILNTANKIYDLAKALRIFNIDGNQISSNGANLKLNKSVGSLFSIGANFTNNEKQPNRVDIASSTAGSFAYINQTAGSTEASTTDVLPNYYDNAGTKTLITPTSNKATVQRVYLFPSGAVRIAYGQTVYSSLTEAIQGIGSESFITNPNIPGNGVLIALIALRADSTDLSDPSQARILEASRFGEGNIGAGGQSVSSLQNAYDNSGEPEILVTDTATGAVSIKDSGSNVNRDNIIEIKDSSDNIVFAVDRNGISVGGSGVALDSQEYTPSFTNQNANVNTITHYTSFYQRIGNVVQVTSYLYLTTNTGSTITEWNMSLPIASTLGSVTKLFGEGWYNQGTDYIDVSGDLTNDAAFITFNAGSTAGFVKLNFTYLIV